MTVEEHKNWRELCYAALDAKDPDELMKILQELKKVLACIIHEGAESGVDTASLR